MTDTHNDKPAADRAAAIRCAEQGRLAEAKALLESICRAGGEDAEAWLWLGRVNGRQGDFQAAADCSRRAAELRPGYAAAYVILGKALQHLGRHEEALAVFRTAVDADPRDPEAHRGMGYAHYVQGRLEEAVRCYEEALRLAPGSAEAHYNVGNMLGAQRRYEAAAAAYEEAIRLDPGFAAAYNNLGATLYKLQDPAAAVARYRRALELDPRYAEAYSNLGTALRDIGRVAEARARFAEALRHNPALVEAHQGLATTARREGDAAAFAEGLRRAREVAPRRADVHSDLLMAMCYLPETTPAVMLEAARAWDRLHAAAVSQPPPVITDPRPQRRLRVGYVSGDFHAHPVGYFIGHLFDHRAPSGHEVFCYYNDTTADAHTERLRAAADHWRDVAGLSDAALAERIRGDGIDILVDLSGHTGHHRLLTFARRPAPVQATWLGYFATTGLSAMDYIIADPVVIPPGDEHWYAEQVVRLPHSYLGFPPPDYDIQPAPAPPAADGRVTFGSFNNQGKVTPQVVACWARVLHAVPGSRLLMKYSDLDAPDIGRRYHALFMEHGIGPERVELQGHSAREEFLRAYRQVDIALDPFPYNGGITTLETLWMGVPVVTLRGDRFVSRVGESILAAAGLPELVASGLDQYVSAAADLARDPARLRRLRDGLRRRLTASPLCDGPGFAAAVERVYREMWVRRCAGHAGLPA